MRFVVLLIGVSIAWGWSSSVCAQPETEAASEGEAAAPTPEEEEARHVFEFGLRAYEQGRYDDAARYFERSFELSGRVELHFNIGSSLEHAGRREEAAAAFERFLAAAPDSDRRAEVEARIRALREGPAEGGASVGGGGGGSDESDDDGGGGAGVGPWLVLGGGVAAAVAGAVFLGLAASAKSTVESAPRNTPWYTVEGDAANAETFGLVGAILVGVGAAAAAGGLVWLIAGGSSDEDGASASVTVTPFGVSASGVF